MQKETKDIRYVVDVNLETQQIVEWQFDHKKRP
jgi:hypothetical protein